MDHMDRMNTSFPGHEAVSDEITAKYLIFDDFSVLAISAAHRDGFCERMCPSLRVGVYLPHTTLPWDHRRLMRRENLARYVVWCDCKGHVGRMGGQIGSSWASASVWDLIPIDSGPGELNVYSVAFEKRGNPSTAESQHILCWFRILSLCEYQIAIPT